MSLRQQALSGVRWTALENALGVAFGILSTSVLARLLDPKDFGLMALATVVLGFSQAFVDIGISNAIIHRQAITHAQLSTLYWLNVLAGACVFVLIAAASGVVANFYGEPELVMILILSAAAFVIQPFGQQYSVLLRKNLQFELLSKIGIANRTFGLVLGVSLAYAGFGVYALVYSGLAAALANTVLLIIVGFRMHRPSMHFRLAEVRGFLGFGAYQMAENTINYFNSNFDVILIGRLLGAEALGLYSVAKKFIMRPAEIINPVVTRVSLPVMAKVQDDAARLRAIYLQTTNSLSSLNFPIYLAICIFADEITLILFGAKWLSAVPVMQVLAIFGALRSTLNPVGSLLLAKGRADLGFWWNLGLFIFVPVGVYIGTTWGIIGAAWSLLAIQFALMIPSWFFLVRPLCKAGFLEYYLQIARPALLAAIAGAGGWAAANQVDGPVYRLALGLAVGAALTVGVYAIANKDFLRKIWEVVKVRS